MKKGGTQKLLLQGPCGPGHGGSGPQGVLSSSLSWSWFLLAQGQAAKTPPRSRPLCMTPIPACTCPGNETAPCRNAGRMNCHAKWMPPAHISAQGRKPCRKNTGLIGISCRNLGRISSEGGRVWVQSSMPAIVMVFMYVPKTQNLRSMGIRKTRQLSDYQVWLYLAFVVMRITMPTKLRPNIHQDIQSRFPKSSVKHNRF